MCNVIVHAHRLCKHIERIHCLGVEHREAKAARVLKGIDTLIQHTGMDPQMFDFQ